MFFDRMVVVLSLIATLSASIFFFAQNNDNDAINVLFLGLYFTFSLYFVLRAFTYIRYKATLNEIFFYIFVNGIALAVFFISPGIPMSASLLMSINFEFFVHGLETSTFTVSIIDTLAIPYFIISLGIFFRCFTKYEFIRYSPQSEKGIPAEFFALVFYLASSLLFIFVGILNNNFVSFFIGISLIVLVLAFLIGK